MIEDECFQDYWRPSESFQHKELLSKVQSLCERYPNAMQNAGFGQQPVNALIGQKP